MLQDDTRRKIKDIVAGTVIEGSEDHCAAIRNLLCRRYPTSTAVKTEFERQAAVKKEQAAIIEDYCDNNHLWVSTINWQNRYLTRGGESRVYLDVDNRHVIKINDAIYYATWLEFLNSVLIHNLIFSNTCYSLRGFVKEDGVLYAVLSQAFVISDIQVDLVDVRKFLAYNEFEHLRRNDYVNKSLGLILEDMHDENVIVNSETLFFIDSVFYTVAPIGG